jgi:hypothetical protein
VIFHDRGVMKNEEKQSAWFLWIFMTAGSWKLKKTRAPDFCDLRRLAKNW